MKGQKGITLVALIITIIVMLILVSVSVSIVIQSDLFGQAESAGKLTENAYNSEKGMSQVVNVNGEYKNISEYYTAD